MNCLPYIYFFQVNSEYLLKLHQDCPLPVNPFFSLYVTTLRLFEASFLERSNTHPQIAKLFDNWLNLSLFHSIIFIRLYLTLLMSLGLLYGFRYDSNWNPSYTKRRQTPDMFPQQGTQIQQRTLPFLKSITFCFVSSLLLTPHLRATMRILVSLTMV